MDDILDILKSIGTNIGFWLMLFSLLPMCSWKNDTKSIGPDPYSKKEKDMYILEDMSNATWSRVRWGSIIENAKAASLVIFAIYTIISTCNGWIKTELDFSAFGSGAISVLWLLLYAAIVIGGTLIWGFGGRLGVNKDPNRGRGAAMVALYVLLVVMDLSMTNKIVFISALQASMMLSFAIVFCQRLPAYLLQFNTEDYFRQQMMANVTRPSRRRR